MVHEMKILPQYYEDVSSGIKTFELRKDDRNVQAGDILLLKEWTGAEYTGKELRVGVTYVLRDCPQYGLAEGYCIIGFVGNEKQIAKKPNYEGDGYYNGELILDTWICPNCNKSYEVDYDDYDYCPNCGQHIDHSGLTEDD